MSAEAETDAEPDSSIVDSLPDESIDSPPDTFVALDTDDASDAGDSEPDTLLGDSVPADSGMDSKADADATDAATDVAVADASDAIVDSDASVCSPGSYVCAGAVLRQCNSAGSGYSDVVTCPSAATCSPSLKRCTFCTPGTYSCSGTDRRVCDSFGSRTTHVATCATAELCAASSGATCTTPACATGDKRCNGKDVEQCNAARTGWDLYNACTAACSAATCIEAVEVAGAPVGETMCARMSDGSVKCWGKNDAGQADGIGTTSPLKKPVNVIGVTAASQISLAATTSGARLSDGSVKVWGSLDALLGTGGSKKAPTPVAGIAGATRFGLGSSGGTAAQSFGCYQTTSAFKCWGYNASGQLCDGSTSADLPPSFSMPAITALTTFWVTPNKLFGIAGGSAKACGENGSGELAIGSFTNATTPSASFTNVSAVAGGQSHSCAIKTDNTVVCAGYDGNGQLADGKYFGSSSTPVAVSGTANSVSIAAGANHTCVVALDGRVRCWGANGYGQLGDGSTTDSSSVVTVTGITTAKSVAATAATTCVLVADRNVSCWGDNSAGALGAALDPSTTPFSKSPVTVTF